MVKVLQVEWTYTAKKSLQKIYDRHAEYSRSLAEKRIDKIIEMADAIVFTQQYQVDDINKSYRRIVVNGEYKVLYKEHSGIIYIMDVVSTKESPEKLKKK